MDLDFAIIKGHIKNDLQLEEIWQQFLVDCLTNHYHHKNSPADDQKKPVDTAWLEKWQAYMPQTMAELEAKKPAFQVSDKMETLTTLATESKKRQIKDKIQLAKKKLSKFNGLTQTSQTQNSGEYLEMIKILNSQLMALENPPEPSPPSEPS